MKKLKDKLLNIKNKKSAEQPAGRITNETVAEHREQILAGGRRFKYPMQYARNTLVRNTVVISIAALVLMVIVFWWQLYLVQNTSKFFYRLTQLAPIPVARTDGESVRYSDYLMELRSALHYLEREDAVNFAGGDAARQRDYQKRTALNKVEDSAYVHKLARERKLSVRDKEVEDFIAQQLTSFKPPVSRENYEQVIDDFYDWSMQEYKLSVRNQLLKRKVSLAIDDAARKKANIIAQQLRTGADFAAVAKAQSDDTVTKNNGGDLGPVPINSDDTEGLLKAAQRMQPNQVSDVITAGNGYYILKLLEKNDSTVRYARIFIDLKELDQRLSKLRDNKKISEYINVPKEVGPSRRP